MLQKTLLLNDCDLKFAEGELRSFEGYASVFGLVDAHNDIIASGAYADVIKAGVKPKMFLEHRWMRGDLPVGKYSTLAEDDHGLVVAGEFTPGHSEADNAYASLKHGTIDGLSVGITIDKTDTKTEKGIRTISRIKQLHEISLVSMPANAESRVDLTSVKSALADVDTIRDFEQFLRDTGHYSKSAAAAIVAAAKAIFADRGEPENADRVDWSGIVTRLNSLSQTIPGGKDD